MIGNWVRRAVLARMICVFALVMLGFTGQGFADPRLDPDSLYYQLPDGTAASLCQPGGGKADAGQGDVDHGKHCQLCFVAVGHAFTPSDAAHAAFLAPMGGETLAAAASANLKRIVSHHGHSRGPPLPA